MPSGGAFGWEGSVVGGGTVVKGWRQYRRLMVDLRIVGVDEYEMQLECGKLLIEKAILPL